MDDDSPKQRKNAELEFVSAAYNKDEAWVCETNETSRVFRRLTAETRHGSASFVLELFLPSNYPGCRLEVTGIVEDERTANNLLKTAHDALLDLLKVCRETAESVPGEEAIFLVFNRADEWITEDWAALVASFSNADGENAPNEKSPSESKKEIILGRNLIYSHHIIGKKKRADMKQLAAELQLTGYIKIGWPGLIIIEGEEKSCQAFYDQIRRWAWQYLVLRGEMRELLPTGTALESKRKFLDFAEVDDMSLVANRCREVGLESLFLTSMKVYHGDRQDDESGEKDIYGALVSVDHMNDGKGYRKWLRKTCNDLGVALLLKQCHPDQDFSQKPLIVVGLIGTRVDVGCILKKWRTSRVDVDSRGRPCFERMMTVLVEGSLGDNPSRIDWEDMNSESRLNTTKELLIQLIGSTGIESWANVVAGL